MKKYQVIVAGSEILVEPNVYYREQGDAVSAITRLEDQHPCLLGRLDVIEDPAPNPLNK